jgi:hypothetical protein
LARKRHNLSADVHPLRADRPILKEHILTFAAKLGLALHYDAKGTAIPSGGGALVMWFSNLQAMKGQIPRGFLICYHPLRRYSRVQRALPVSSNIHM